MKFRIEYCTAWNYAPQAAGLAAELRAAFGQVEIELVQSRGGAFEVDLDGRRIFSKLAEDRFPAYQEIPKLAL